MTVREMIEALKKYPLDAHVTRSMCSDDEGVEEDQWVFIPASDKKIILRQGWYQTYYPDTWPKLPLYSKHKGQKEIPGEQPVFVDILHLGGN